MADARSRFVTEPAVLRHGTGCVAALGDELADLGRERALVVTGRTVGDTAAVMDPIRAGLGDRLAGVFAETTPEKRLSTALSGVDAFEGQTADTIVSVGGGSSHDVARAVAVLASRDLGADAAGREFAETGTLEAGPEPQPILVVPTTFAGADLSQAGGLTAHPDTDPVDEPISGGTGAPSLFPAAAFYDPEMVATTPRSILASSAMNGFDKGIESLYARNRTPITDATAMRGIERFAEGLLAFGEDDEAGIPAAVEGIMLVQYGISRPDASTASLIHALGKFLARASGLPQGVGHAIVAPATLAAIFEAVDGRREVLARALGAGDAGDSAEAVVARVARVRASLGVTTRVRAVDGIRRADLPDIAANAAAHRFAGNGPPGLDPGSDWFEAVLDEAW